MGKYLVSFGDSNKYEVDFPGTLDQFKNSETVASLKEKVADFIKSKFPAASNLENIVPVHIEEAGNGSYEKLDLSKIGDLLKDALTQVGVDKFTDKLNLNAPFDKLF